MALQPQDYLLDGITPMPRCIVITGAATVAPDATTGAAVWMAHNVALVGAAASLSASTNCKGLVGFVNGFVALRNGAHLHMDKLGKAGNFGDLSPDMLLPAALARRIATRKLQAYVIQGDGAAGAARTAVVGGHSYLTGNNGAAAGPMQTGGGGGGSSNAAGVGDCYGGAGGKGGPCGGGASGSPGLAAANGIDAGDFGGPGGNAGVTTSVTAIAGGGGDPAGSNYLPTGYTFNIVFQALAGGGLLGLFAAHFDVGYGCLTSADGSPGTVITGGNYGAVNGPGTGGGCVVICTKPGGYHNSGTVRAAGGLHGGTQPYYEAFSGDGGAGSVNLFELVG